LRHDYNSAWQVVYSQTYRNLVALWVRTLQEDKIFCRLDDNTLCQFDVLDASKLCDEHDGEAVYALYGKMRRAMDVFPWVIVLIDVARRDKKTGEARNVRVTVDETTEYGFSFRHSRVNFNWAHYPNAPAHAASIPPNHLGVRRRCQNFHPEGGYAIIGDRGGFHCPSSTRRERSRSRRRDR